MGTTLLSQIVLVPLFLHGVGVRQYAAWLILTAIPTYLTLASDLGFGGAASTVASQRLAQGDAAGALRVLNATWVLVSRASAFVMTVAVAGSFFITRGTSFHSLSSGTAQTILVLQIVSVALSVQIGIVEGAFRSGGLYPRGINYVSLSRLGELLTAGLVLIVDTRPLVAVAASTVGVRFVAVVLMHVSARSRMSWFRLSWRRAQLSEATKLMGASIAYAGFTLSAAVVNQGYTLLLGTATTATELVTFTTVRTLCNSILQFVVAATNGVLPELTFSLTRGEQPRARRIYIATLRLTLWFGAAACILLVILGPLALRLWTHGAANASTAFLALMAATTAADIPWRNDANVLRAVNGHRLVGLLYVVACGLSLAACGLLLSTLGLLAAPVSLFLIDVLITPVARPRARRILAGLRSSGGRRTHYGVVTSTIAKGRVRRE